MRINNATSCCWPVASFRCSHTVAPLGRIGPGRARPSWLGFPRQHCSSLRRALEKQSSATLAVSSARCRTVAQSPQASHPRYASVPVPCWFSIWLTKLQPALSGLCRQPYSCSFDDGWRHLPHHNSIVLWSPIVACVRRDEELGAVLEQTHRP